MASILNEVEILGRRETFNMIVNHVKTVIEIVDTIDGYYNIADVINDLIGEERLQSGQVNPIINSLLVDKYNYSVESVNLDKNMSSFDQISDEMAKWNAVDMVLIYFHPELGISVINPKRLESWQAIQNLKRYELVNIFVGGVKGDIDGSIKDLAITRCIELLNLGKPKPSPSLNKGPYKVREIKKQKVQEEKPAKPVKEKKAKKSASAAAPVKAVKKKTAAPSEAGTGKKRMTPFYSIPVTNELFHNGNVEAWKKIIESYTTKYADLDVYIFYEGERIHDINTLFKWGKVKHGSSILIAVAGNDIQDVAKLQRYLKQGASHMFEAFLRFPVNHILNLF
ncbi:MAG: hypothetical protein JW904_07810 [Spirochaetales bacterium]|nr:hypothetical protein [Spirochaetales bacterium]